MNSSYKTETPILEPLEDLAWQAFHAAEQTCDPEYGCGAYHRFWSLKRLLTGNSAPPRGLTFFTKHLRELGQDGAVVRILLAGSADIGLPTLMANAAFEANRVPSITVVDRCASPLTQIRSLAERTGLDITTHQGELSAVKHNSFDAAITHNVMLFNTDTARQEIFNKLSDGLKPGGRLLSTETVCDTVLRRGKQEIDAQIASFELALEHRELSATETRHVLDAAHAFLTRKSRVASYPEEDLRRHVSDAGLSLLSFETRPKGSNESPGSRLIKTSDHSYAFVAAQKPA